ncbi:MAG: hypothetical protein R3C28_23390 [Pirellulaceae bacterium]
MTTASASNSDETHSKAKDQDYPAVTIAVAKQKGRNAVTIAQDLEHRLSELEQTVIPDDVRPDNSQLRRNRR